MRPEIKDETGDVFRLEFSSNGAILAAAYGNGSVCLYNPASGRRLHKLQHASNHPIPSLAFRPGGGDATVLLTVSSTGQVCHWHVSRGTQLDSFVEANNEVYTCAFNPDGTMFLTAGKDMAVRCYDERTSQLLSTLRDGDDHRTSGHTNRVFSARYQHNDGNVIVSGGWDTTIQLWDLRAGHSVYSYYGPNVCGDSLDVVDNYLIAGSWKASDQLYVFDLRARTEAQNIFDWARQIPPAASLEEYQAAIAAYREEAHALEVQAQGTEKMASAIMGMTKKEVEIDDDAELARVKEKLSSKAYSDLLIDTLDTSLPWHSNLVTNSLETTLLYSVSVSKDIRTPLVAACGSGANEAKVLNWRTGDVLGGIRLPKAGFAAALSPDARYAAFAGSGFGIWLANVPDAAELAAAQQGATSSATSLKTKAKTGATTSGGGKGHLKQPSTKSETSAAQASTSSAIKTTSNKVSLSRPSSGSSTASDREKPAKALQSTAKPYLKQPTVGVKGPTIPTAATAPLNSSKPTRTPGSQGGARPLVPTASAKRTVPGGLKQDK